MCSAYALTNWELRDIMRLIFAAILLMLAPGAARAAWLEASSAHFVVYADANETSVRRFSENLEKYHSALEQVTGGKTAVPSPSNRVTVYVVGSVGRVQKLLGDNSRNIAGFYISRAGGSIAIVPRISTRTTELGTLDQSMIVLLHEYAHHFMHSKSAFAIPAWISEGGAEFFASASFGRDGGVGLGRAALHRAGELFHARDVTAAQLLDPQDFERRRKSRNAMDSYYGKAWLLYHYLTLGGKRDGQFQRYLSALGKGKSSQEAGLEAFGPFDKLESELDAYLRRSRIMMLTLPPDMVKISPIKLRPLSEGEAAMMPITIRSRRGVNREQAAEVLTEARAVAALYPGDAAVLSALAEAEHDAGNDAEAIAAADQALAIDSTRVNAYVQKGFAMFRLAADSNAPDAYLKARAPFVALNRIENDHPIPLVYFYRSYVQSGQQPTKLAVDGLNRAVQVAPFDQGLRMTLAMQDLRDGNLEWARQHFAPIAYNPHGGSLAEAARSALERLTANPNWRGDGLSAPAQEPASEGDGKAPARPSSRSHEEQPVS